MTKAKFYCLQCSSLIDVVYDKELGLGDIMICPRCSKEGYCTECLIDNHGQRATFISEDGYSALLDVNELENWIKMKLSEADGTVPLDVRRKKKTKKEIKDKSQNISEK